MEELLEFLKERIGEHTTLEEAISAFEEMSRLPAETEDALLFEAGDGKNEFYFALVRQTEKEEEYLQLHLEIRYPEVKKPRSLREVKWDSDFRGNREKFFRHVRSSKAFEELKNIPYRKIELYIDET